MENTTADGWSTSISLQTMLCGCLTSAHNGRWVGWGMMIGWGKRANGVPDGSQGSLMKFTITLAPAITPWGQMALYVIEEASAPTQPELKKTPWWPDDAGCNLWARPCWCGRAAALTLQHCPGETRNSRLSLGFIDSCIAPDEREYLSVSKC